jgi:hypothetical protein
MGLFSKKKEEKSMLPDLPESSANLPELPTYGAENSNNANLKADVPANTPSNVNPVQGQQNAIKNEIHGGMASGNNMDMQKSNFEALPHYSNNNVPAKIVAEPSNVLEEHPRMPHESFHEPRTLEMSNSRLPSKIGKIESSVKRAQPIYIRLDKFKAGLESFEDIKGKLTEIEDLLVKIKEMKDKEEKELDEWEREIQVVKARIEQIDNDVFKNVE